MAGRKAGSFLLSPGHGGAQGRHVTTLEGLQKEAEEFGMFLLRGGEQCGFCSPGFIMNVLAMERELSDPTEEEIKFA